MDKEDSEARQRLLEQTRDELAAGAKANAEAYDRALLTLSSAFLGGSLAFIDKVIELPVACGKPLLYLAWGFFALTIIFTVVSLMYGVLSFRWLSQAAERFYGQNDKSAWQVSDKTQRTVMRFIWACGVLFIAGIVFLVLFIFINLSGEASFMTKLTTPQKVERGIPSATFQKPAAKPPANTNAGNSQAKPQTLPQGTSKTEQKK
jgi:hypothetical protein